MTQGGADGFLEKSHAEDGAVAAEGDNILDSRLEEDVAGLIAGSDAVVVEVLAGDAVAEGVGLLALGGQDGGGIVGIESDEGGIAIITIRKFGLECCE